MATQITKSVDTKLPLTWVISSAFGIIFSVGGVYIELKNISNSLEKIERKNDLRDDKIQQINQMAIETNGRVTNQQSQLERAQLDMSELRRDFANSPKMTRWVAK
jgi:hypothetical protein